MTRFSLVSVLVVLWLALPHELAAAPNPARVESHACTVIVTSGNQSLAEDLLETCEAAKEKIYPQLGIEDTLGVRPVDLRLVPRPSDMKDVSPTGSAPPSWSGAVAYPKFNVIILSKYHKSGAPVEDLDTVLEHEMSHLALRAVLGDAEVPRWFSEGVAIMQSEHSSMRRIWLVWTAAFGDSLLPLAAINKYPDRPGQINLAYAEAADFTNFLIGEGGWPAIRAVINLTASGTRFEEAIEVAFGRTLRDLEVAWRASLMNNWQWVPLVTGTGALWGLIVVLFFVAFAVVQRKKKKRLLEMEAEEMLAVEPRNEGPRRRPREPMDPAGPKVPTKIRVDDEIHTLHCMLRPPSAATN